MPLDDNYSVLPDGTKFRIELDFDATTPAALTGPVKPAPCLPFTASSLVDLLDRCDWAILAAENPGGQACPSGENTERTAALAYSLRRAGFDYVPLVGRYGGIDETSFLVLDIDEQHARGIGAHFRQESVLVPRGLYFLNSGLLVPATGIVVFEK